MDWRRYDRHTLDVLNHQCITVHFKPSTYRKTSLKYTYAYIHISKYWRLNDTFILLPLFLIKKKLIIYFSITNRYSSLSITLSVWLCLLFQHVLAIHRNLHKKFQHWNIQNELFYTLYSLFGWGKKNTKLVAKIHARFFKKTVSVPDKCIMQS